MKRGLVSNQSKRIDDFLYGYRRLYEAKLGHVDAALSGWELRGWRSSHHRRSACSAKVLIGDIWKRRESGVSSG